jgi:hypothetical protein
LRKHSARMRAWICARRCSSSGDAFAAAARLLVLLLLPLPRPLLPLSNLRGVLLAVPEAGDERANTDRAAGVDSICNGGAVLHENKFLNSHPTRTSWVRARFLSLVSRARTSSARCMPGKLPVSLCQLS